MSLGTDTPPSSTSRTKPNFISNNKTDMTSYNPTEAILTTTHNLMTSLITANRSHLTSTKPITYTKETFLTSLVANTRRPVTVKKSDSNDVAAKTLTNISTTQTHFYNPELIFTNTTAQKYSGVSTNTSTMEHRPVELSTSFSNFSSSSSGEYDLHKKWNLDFGANFSILHDSQYPLPLKSAFDVRRVFFVFFFLQKNKNKYIYNKKKSHRKQNNVQNLFSIVSVIKSFFHPKLDNSTCKRCNV